MRITILAKKTGTQGCCGFDPKGLSNFGGGHIATIVITNHGARGVVDPTPYNHYSLLRTTEDALGISEYLNEAGDLEQRCQTDAETLCTEGSTI